MSSQYIEEIRSLPMSSRIRRLKEKAIVKKRYASFEQARIITECYRRNEGLSIAKKRALSFYDSCIRLEIGIAEDELIVGNRTKRPRDGVVFPEGGITWTQREIDDLETRAQDPFTVTPEDRASFFEEILPFWKGRTLEDHVAAEVGDEISKIGLVANINQTDHAQGHICPNTKTWLTVGPAGLRGQAQEKLKTCAEDQREFYECVSICMDGAIAFMLRYRDLALELSKAEDLSEQRRQDLMQIAANCGNLAKRPAKGYWEALQSAWFMFVMLHMESNASSFSPGRYDQVMLPYLTYSMNEEGMTLAEALELTECLWL